MGNGKDSSQLAGNFLFPKIFQTFRMAIQPSKLIISLLAMAIICLAGWIMDFSKTVVATRDAQGEIMNTELQIYVDKPDQLQSWIEENKEEGEGTGLFSTLWQFDAAIFHGAVNSLVVLDLQGVKSNIIECFQGIAWAVKYHPIYCIIFGLIKLAVISVAGGAICRIAALQFAQGERPGLTEAVRFSTEKFTSFFTAPLAPICIIVFIGFFIFLLGLVGNIPWAGELIIGIFMILALIAAVLIAIVLIGTVAGFNLMFPAVSYEGSDCFDAISRAFSYVYTKPWHMGFYTAIAAVYGAICYVFVRFFTFLLLWVTRWFLQLGVLGGNKKLTAIWPEQPSFMSLRVQPDWQQLIWSEWLAAVLVYFFLLVVVGLLVSFIISFYFSANTIIYSLMRNRVDNTALEDVYKHTDEVKTEPLTTEAKSEEESQPTSDSET